MSRREARLARDAERLLRQAEKKARLAASVEHAGSPRVSSLPDSRRKARATEEPNSIMQMQMSFSIFEHADREQSWSWGQARNWCTVESRSGGGCLIRTTLESMSRLTWAEILAQTTGGRERHNKHHGQSVDSLCAEAQERWEHLERTEGELFRFRVGGKQRIWGVRHGAKFFVVWWDAEHKVYPTERD